METKTIDILNYKLTDIPLDIYTNLIIATSYDLHLLDHEIKRDSNKCVHNCDCYKLLEIAKKISDELINLFEYIISNKNKIYKIFFLGKIYGKNKNVRFPRKIFHNIEDYLIDNIEYLKQFTHLTIVDKHKDRVVGIESKYICLDSITIGLTQNDVLYSALSKKIITCISNRFYKNSKLDIDNIDIKEIHTITAINLLNDKINTNVEKYEHEIQELCDIFRTKMDESSNNNLKMTNILIDEIINSNKEINKNDNEDIFKYIDDFCDEKMDNIYDKITNIEMTINDQYNELKNENKLLKNKINELEKNIIDNNLLIKKILENSKYS